MKELKQTHLLVDVDETGAIDLGWSDQTLIADVTAFVLDEFTYPAPGYETPNLVGWKPLYARIWEGNYEEATFDLVFSQRGKLWFLSASHCSCHGYEECWTPQHVTLTWVQSKHCPLPAEAKAHIAKYAPRCGKQDSN